MTKKKNKEAKTELRAKSINQFRVGLPTSKKIGSYLLQ